MALLAAESVTSFFHDAVKDAIARTKVEVSDVATTYVVGLLADFAHKRNDDAWKKPFLISLNEALETPAPAQRFERLRGIGDGVLYGCGFFRDHFQARGISESYLFGIGARAYGTASEMLRVPSHDVLGELASRFDAFAALLCEVSDAILAKRAVGENPHEIVKLYERWLKTGSATIAQSLTEQGLIPVRGAKGTN